MTKCIRCPNEVEGNDLQCRQCAASSGTNIPRPREVPSSEPTSIDPRERMSAGELEMANVLDMRKRTGEVLDWWFEAITFEVGIPRCRYKPDFFVLLPGLGIEIIEIKGEKKWEDSLVKFKAAVKEYGLVGRWQMLEYAGGQWRTMHDYTATPTKERTPNETRTVGPGDRRES